MSPGIELLVVLVLLCGPTALWLVFRVARSKDVSALTRFRETTAWDVTDPATGPGGAGFWTCAGCHSLNRANSTRCYHCRAAVASRQQPPTSDGQSRPMVAVMSAEPQREAVPVMAPQRKAASGRTPSASPAGQSTALPQWPAVLAPAVCPHLGLKDDRHTRFDFPYPLNVCHAGEVGNGEGVGLRGLLVRLRPADGRPPSITLVEQRTLCLTAEHVSCPRYRDVSGGLPIALPSASSTALRSTAYAPSASVVLTSDPDSAGRDSAPATAARAAGQSPSTPAPANQGEVAVPAVPLARAPVASGQITVRGTLTYPPTPAPDAVGTAAPAPEAHARTNTTLIGIGGPPTSASQAEATPAPSLGPTPPGSASADAGSQEDDGPARRQATSRS